MANMFDWLFFIVSLVLLIYIISPIDFISGIEYDDAIAGILELLGLIGWMIIKVKR